MIRPVSAVVSTNLIHSQQSLLKSRMVNFEGKQYPSGYYDDYEIDVAKKYVDRKEDSWKDELYKEKLGSESMDLDTADGVVALFMRIAAGITTLGLSEAWLAKCRKQDKAEAKNFVNRISRLVYDMRIEKQLSKIKK